MLRCCEKKGDKQLQSAYLLSMFCRDDQTRTGDLAPPRRVRYQLRYIPILLEKGSAKVGKLQDIAKYIPWFSIKKVI